MLTDGSDGDLIRSFLIPHSVHNDLFLTWHWGRDKAEAGSDEGDSLAAKSYNANVTLAIAEQKASSSLCTSNILMGKLGSICA